MLPLFVGYQYMPDGGLVEAILSYKDRVREVYFAWPGIANGRTTAGNKWGIPPFEVLDRQRADLARLSGAGIGLNLLLNGNCYGEAALSRAFFTRIGDLIDALGERYGLAAITTASPLIARFTKENFPDLDVRASVNMEIGGEEGIAYLSEWMDGFYVKRELNRDLEAVRTFSRQCRCLGKKVYLLANSGCLNYCSARTFHDNLVSHEAEVMQMDNAYAFQGLCRHFLASEENRQRILYLSNWIRPEDVCQYEGLVDGVKLATRVSERPAMILAAYARGRFSGDLLSLTEPDLSGLFLPRVLSGQRMPEDFLRHSGDRVYCEELFHRVTEDISPYGAGQQGRKAHANQ